MLPHFHQSTSNSWKQRSVYSLFFSFINMLCDSCADYQEHLLDSGDGSQVICEHQLTFDEEPGTSTSALPTTTYSSSSKDTNATAAETSSRKRKFVTADRFAELASVKLRRKIVPIKKWRQLKENIPFAVLQIHSIEVAANKGKKKQTSFYAELQTEDGEMFNVWITELIHQELLKYNLEHSDVYIMALGKATSKSTGRDYFNFAVVQDN